MVLSEGPSSIFVRIFKVQVIESFGTLYIKEVNLKTNFHVNITKGSSYNRKSEKNCGRKRYMSKNYQLQLLSISSPSYRKC